MTIKCMIIFFEWNDFKKKKQVCGNNIAKVVHWQ